MPAADHRHFFILISTIIYISSVRALVNENLALSSSSKSDGFVDIPDEVKTDERGGGLLNTIISWLPATNLLHNSISLFSGNGDLHDAGVFMPYFESDHPESTKWIWSCVASVIVALTGVVPAFFLRSCGNSRSENVSERRLNRLLSFAVGSLLGDVFLHILPETWRYASTSTSWGMWVILGSVLCFMLEKCSTGTEDSKHKAAAFVNLCANAVDNFMHGLAVGASFSVSIKFGVLTTFAILIHEIPHEISDFAILLRANFDRWSAIKAQLITATGGVFGASVALLCNDSAISLEQRATCWILPFTAGGFLNVALVQVLPDLMKETSIAESALQIMYIFCGVCLMGLVSIMHL